MNQIFLPAAATPQRQGTRRLFLCRHGETALNQQGKLQGRRMNPPLNGNGLEQAAQLAQALAGQRIDLVAASTMLRARQTAAAVASASNNRRVALLEELAEIDFGSASDGLDLEEAERRTDALWLAWAQGQVDARPAAGGGESLREVLERFAQAAQRMLEAVPADGGVAVAVTHSGLLDVVMAAALAHEARFGDKDEAWWLASPQTWNLLAARHLREDNACFNVLEFDSACTPPRGLVRVPVVGYRHHVLLSLPAEKHAQDPGVTE